MSIERFTIAIPQNILDDLNNRLDNTRWLDALGDEGWKYGLSIPWMRKLISYWRNNYDWREQEEELNSFANFRVTLRDDTAIHFIYERGRGPAPLPIILTHGFPDSFARFATLIPLLTDPAAYGGSEDDAFDVVVPSLPGFAFSPMPTPHVSVFRVGDLWNELMTKHLGYDRYVAHGGDWGSTITEFLARDHSDHVLAMHLTDVPFMHVFQKPKVVTHAEQKYLDQIQKWQQTDGGYALVQGSQTQALALGLNDSPAGLAAWLIEKYRRWSDCDGDVERSFTKDQLLTNVMLYWATQTINSSFLPYHDVASAGAMTWIGQKFKEWEGSAKVPAAFAMFPKDLSRPPSEWAERFFNVQRWTEMPRGGHFAAMEEPELLAEDIRASFRPLRSGVARSHIMIGGAA